MFIIYKPLLLITLNIRIMSFIYIIILFLKYSLYLFIVNILINNNYIILNYGIYYTFLSVILSTSINLYFFVDTTKLLIICIIRKVL